MYKRKMKVKEMYMQERKKATRALFIPRRRIVSRRRKGVSELTGKGNNKF